MLLLLLLKFEICVVWIMVLVYPRGLAKSIWRNRLRNLKTCILIRPVEWQSSIALWPIWSLLGWILCWSRVDLSHAVLFSSKQCHMERYWALILYHSRRTRTCNILICHWIYIFCIYDLTGVGLIFSKPKVSSNKVMSFWYRFLLLPQLVGYLTP